MKKIFAVVFLMIGLGAASLPNSGYAQVTGDYSTIKPLAPIKEWKYKYENGNYYKRLYNYSTGKWEGPWIKC
ncbi:hypothetical protein [Enterococcus sp.]|uniref:hypothetical protein n=1 Tax=Enterococcus sp. TaxID=35783 RepID=UPI002908A69B|nr:hypothetical protein [Enterococcus sp.]MDU5337331.1 hypothetical protein [Enterococcus sp.]